MGRWNDIIARIWLVHLCHLAAVTLSNSSTAERASRNLVRRVL
jgi:hypothetical protein